MKKIFSFLAATLAVVSMSAQTVALNNPVGADNRYIVKWDCAKGDWAASNDFEPGETFTFAVDITGTPWEADIQNPAVAGTTRAIAAHIWFNFAEKSGVDRAPATERLQQIDGNIYGATYNFAQQLGAMSAENQTLLTAEGAILYAWCNLHIFNYKEDGTTGDEWYVNWAQVLAPGSEVFFASLPSTGKLDPAFANNMYGLDPEAGVDAPCASQEETAVETVVGAKKAVKVLENGQLIIKHNGVRYNALGTAIH